MSKGNNLESAFIDAVFGAGSVSPTATLYVSLHTASPGEAGNQSTNEATVGGYARQAVAVPAGWNTAGNTCDNQNEILFPEITSGSETITHFAVGTALSGAGSLYYFGALTAPVPADVGITIKFNANSLTITEE